MNITFSLRNGVAGITHVSDPETGQSQDKVEIRDGVEFVTIDVQGDGKQVIDRAVTDDDRLRFNLAYMDFRAGIAAKAAPASPPPPAGVQAPAPIGGAPVAPVAPPPPAE